MGELEKIKAKIKKLFALSRSPNANEAALALELAQKLMIEHGIKRNDVGEFEVIEEDIKGNGSQHPPKHEAYLIARIATAFGCKSAYGLQKPKSEFDCCYWGHVFVGLEHRVKIACFIAEVLLRKLRKARKGYMERLKRVRIRTTKIKRADEFCLGWVCTVVNKLNEFTNTQDEERAIDNYVANLKWGNNLKTISRGSIKSSAIDDFMKGRQAAASVQIQSGVEGKESGALLLQGAN